VSTLQGLDLIDFTGGVNLRANQFQVADNESPRMLNVEIEPGRGFFTRKGWERWNEADVVDPALWDPRSTEINLLSDGGFQVYVTNDEAGGNIYAAGDDGIFTSLGVACDASPHLADFAPWGDTMYIVCGTGESHKRFHTDAPVGLIDASTSWNPNYTTPTHGKMPMAEHVQAHASYIFVAGTTELGDDPGSHPNRIRWSHPDEPEDWAADDFLDIETGGGEITALRSFQDHLLIFKTDSLWALYGYDLESWQLVRVSRAIGAPAPTSVAQSESITYFFSASGRAGIYAYDGNSVSEISVPLRPVAEGILPTRIRDVWLGFVCHRLWCSVPWAMDDPANGNTIGVFDPDIGDGVWVAHRPALGSMRSIIEGSDIGGECALAVLHVPAFVDPDPGNPTPEEDPDRSHPGAACLVRLEMLPAAVDIILEDMSETPFYAEYRTNWKHLGKPELRKSFLRTRFLAPRQETDTELRLDIYWDYDTTVVRRSLHGVVIRAGTQVFWRELGFDSPLPGGFDFKELGKADPSGRGADFGVAPGGAMLGRTNLSLGVCRAVQLHFSTVGTEAGKPWGFDGIFMKVRERRFTT